MGSFMINYPSYKNSSIYSPLFDLFNEDFRSSPRYVSKVSRGRSEDPFVIRDTTATIDGIFELKVIAPGRSREDFSVTVEENTVHVKTVEREGSEFSSNYTWCYTLYPQQDADSISVTMENGVLTLKIPKKAPQEPEVRQITIT